jgi:pyrroloquinoline quinone biosynthesis protein B
MWTGLVALVGLVSLVGVGCDTPDDGDGVAEASNEPYLVVLGVAQDGGYPQIACEEPLCDAARRDPSRARFVASLLLVDPRPRADGRGRRWLFDATPDLARQVELARPHGGAPRGEGARPPLFDGVFLTHAHAGHYVGLWQLGREAYGSAPTLVHATPRTCGFLRENGPWSLLVDAAHIAPQELVPGTRLELAPDLTVTAIEVPHRAEFTDTVAFVIEGPTRSALFLPDIDKWERFERPIEGLVAAVDVAYLDGTFFDGDELPGRDMAQIPHPFVVESLARFEPLAAAERAKVRFLHLNHSNPLLDATSEATARVRAAGLAVAAQGEVFGL